MISLVYSNSSECLDLVYWWSLMFQLGWSLVRSAEMLQFLATTQLKMDVVILFSEHNSSLFPYLWLMLSFMNLIIFLLTHRWLPMALAFWPENWRPINWQISDTLFEITNCEKKLWLLIKLSHLLFSVTNNGNGPILWNKTGSKGWLRLQYSDCHHCSLDASSY